MNVSRRNFLGGLGAFGAAAALPGCRCPLGCACGPKAKIALQLYSIRPYTEGVFDPKTKKLLKQGVGFERTLEEVAAIGYRGIEFAGYGGKKAPELKALLAANGLEVCGTHLHNRSFGFNTTAWTYDPEVLKRTLDFELAYGNTLAICPGGGNFPAKDKWGDAKFVDDFIRRLVDLYNKAAADAGKLGCRLGFHNHTNEFRLKMLDGTTYWDYFLSHTDPRVCMEQDVGWTTCAGVDPKEQYRKYPRRAPTLHAKENGMGKNVKSFDAILGQPGKPDATPVDWDGLIPVTEADGVAWYVVECERHRDDLSAVTPSYAFLKSKGLN